MAKFIDWFMLKPMAVLYGPGLIIYGIFFKNGTWIHVSIGVSCIVVASMIGQTLEHNK